MRKSCIDCTIKHLGTAAVYDEEMRMGYPQYYVFLVGNLEHASEEIYRIHHELAMVIREHRIALQMDRTHVVPYEALADYLDTMASTEDDDLTPFNAEDPWPDIPSSCLEGLEIDEQGKCKFSMDTRP